MTKFKFLEPAEEKKSEIVPKFSGQLSHTFDLALVKEMIFLYQDEVNKMFEQAEALEVNSDATNKDATELGTTAMVLYKKIKGVVVPMYEEAKEYVEKTDSFKKMLTEKLNDPSGKKRTVVSIMKSKISQYTAVVISNQRKQQELADKATKDLQSKLNDDAKKTGTKAPDVKPMIVQEKETTVRTETGSSHPVTKWTHEITDLEKVPVELLRRAVLENQGQAALKRVIQDEIKKGVRAIEGVRIFEDITTTFRT